MCHISLIIKSCISALDVNEGNCGVVNISLYVVGLRKRKTLLANTFWHVASDPCGKFIEEGILPEQMKALVEALVSSQQMQNVTY